MLFRLIFLSIMTIMVFERKTLKLTKLTTEQRRIAVDATPTLPALPRPSSGVPGVQGRAPLEKGWLQGIPGKMLDREGHQRSLGPRSPQTEETFLQFVRKKKETANNCLQDQLTAQAKFLRCRRSQSGSEDNRWHCAATRLKSSSGTHLIILGSHAIYAYEMAAGVQLQGRVASNQRSRHAARHKNRTRNRRRRSQRRIARDDSKDRQKLPAGTETFISRRQ